MAPLTQSLFDEFSADPNNSKDKFMITSCEAPGDVTEAVIRGEGAQVDSHIDEARHTRVDAHLLAIMLSEGEQLQSG
jgi:hypothetical protein